jgi:PRTRC genetic system protein C
MAESIKLIREFKHGDIILDDPGESMTKEQVLDFYSNQFPELTNAHINGPTVIEDKLQFVFSTSVGTKG